MADDASSEPNIHVLLLPYPSQGHINPILQFGKRLAAHRGVRCTLAATRFALGQSQQTQQPGPVRVAAISDGCDRGGVAEAGGVDAYLPRLESAGSDTVGALLRSEAEQGRPVHALVYDAFLPWAQRVARRHGVACAAAFFTQPCAVDAAYAHAWAGRIPLPPPAEEPLVDLPGLPAGLRPAELPSFLVDPSDCRAYLDLLVGQFDNLHTADHVLVNSFHELQPQESDYMASTWRAKTVGPTVPSAYLDNTLPDDTSYGFHLYAPLTAATKAWLDTRPPRSVVYASFGSISAPSPAQMAEVAEGLLGCGKQFLWVVRASETSKIPEKFAGKAAERGLVVTWSPQLEVLAHPAVGCFLTHCGWNSTTEGLSAGLPMVAMPQWSDQPMNAKYIEDVWEVGVRVRLDEEGVVRKEEIQRCVGEVMDGERSKEYQRNAAAWKEKAKRAVSQGGSSATNIVEFLGKLGLQAAPPAAKTMAEADSEQHIHVLLLPNPSQGHINPILQFGKRLAAHRGVRCTLAVTRFVLGQSGAPPPSSPVHVAAISDGCDRGGFGEAGNIEAYTVRLEAAGSETVGALLRSEAERGRPVRALVYDAFLPWAQGVARRHGVACAAAFFTQPCAVDVAYGHAWAGRLAPPSQLAAGAAPLALPGLPDGLAPRDLPTFLTDPDDRAYLELLVNQFRGLDTADHVLVNSFYELQPQESAYMESAWRAKTVGPAVPSAYLDNRLPDDTSYGFHLYTPLTETTKSWLDARRARSVVYVSFGSIAKPGEAQTAEMAEGLYGSGRDFLWVVRASETSKLPEGFADRAKGRGLVVTWSPQLEVLAHPAVGCFVTHCGWNSTMEGLGAGVPMVAMPQWSDQTMNAKYIEDVWRVGVRVRPDEEGVVRREEVEACVREVMEGERSGEYRENATGWKEKARSAMSEGGSSDRNILEFLSKIGLKK
ncbi:hypothetical protein U9M48_014924 [Paspalum notatum var. saurae]|uniref:Deoxynivalenol-UDP-glucosyltransferase n=1 Tax=Paspalum notatum var. saurae TaxID=547442 RepID=A0AAQ3T255_PASNO